MLLKQVTAETIYSQIDLVSQRNVADAYALLISGLGPPPTEFAATDTGEVVEELGADNRDDEFQFRRQRKAAVVIGATRDVGRVRGRMLRTAAIQADPKHAAEIWRVYDNIKDFMLRGRKAKSDLSDETRAGIFFSKLRRMCGNSCLEIIDSLEEYCNQRRQFDVQKRLHFWLHGWLPIHIGLSVAVTVLLVGHIVTAVRF
jgi:hypothetical protein